MYRLFIPLFCLKLNIHIFLYTLRIVNTWSSKTFPCIIKGSLWSRNSRLLKLNTEHYSKFRMFFSNHFWTKRFVLRKRQCCVERQHLRWLPPGAFFFLSALPAFSYRQFCSSQDIGAGKVLLARGKSADPGSQISNPI